MKLKLSSQHLKRAVFNQFLPGILGGVVSGWLEGKTPGQFYYYIKEHTGEDWFAVLISPNVQKKIRGMADDLNWLNIEWFVSAIIKEHRDIAVLIYSSEEIRNELSRQIEIIKEKLT